MAMIPINRNPSLRELKWLAGVWFPLFWFVVGSIAGRLATDVRVAAGVWSLAAMVSIACWLHPRFARVVYLGWMRATYPIGWLVAHLAMAAIYFGVLTPIGLALRACGRDALRRTFDRKADSYWTVREQHGDASSYFRQY